jgi:hypothetical protein
MSPIRFLMAPEIAPRTEWVCQPVAKLIASMLAPFGLRSIEITAAILVVEAMIFFFGAAAFEQEVRREFLVATRCKPPPIRVGWLRFDRLMGFFMGLSVVCAASMLHGDKLQ